MGVIEEAVDHLWANDKIAVHCPGVDGSKGAPDKTSIEPNDYDERTDKQNIRVFKEMNESGGYIWAEYRNKVDVKIGKILPRSFEPYETKWQKFPSRIAVLKTLQIDKSSIKILHPIDAISLRASRPQQGTVRHWHRAESKLRSLVDNDCPQKSWGWLSPPQQETACSEYLRTYHFSNCPVLAHLLMPVGRILKDIDILGYATDGKRILAQVTYASKAESSCEDGKP